MGYSDLYDTSNDVVGMELTDGTVADMAWDLDGTALLCVYFDFGSASVSSLYPFGNCFASRIGISFIFDRRAVYGWLSAKLGAKTKGI